MATCEHTFYRLTQEKFWKLMLPAEAKKFQPNRCARPQAAASFAGREEPFETMQCLGEREAVPRMVFCARWAIHQHPFCSRASTDIGLISVQDSLWQAKALILKASKCARIRRKFRTTFRQSMSVWNYRKIQNADCGDSRVYSQMTKWKHFKPWTWSKRTLFSY